MPLLNTFNCLLLLPRSLLSFSKPSDFLWARPPCWVPGYRSGTQRAVVLPRCAPTAEVTVNHCLYPDPSVERAREAPDGTERPGLLTIRPLPSSGPQIAMNTKGTRSSACLSVFQAFWGPVETIGGTGWRQVLGWCLGYPPGYGQVNWPPQLPG